MWKDLTTEQKAEIFKNAVSAGLTNLEDIKKLYNKQAKESRPDLEDPYPIGMGDNFYDDGGIIYGPYDLPTVDYTQTDEDINTMHKLQRMFPGYNTRRMVADYIGPVNRYYEEQGLGIANNENLNRPQLQWYLDNINTERESVNRLYNIYEEANKPLLNDDPTSTYITRRKKAGFIKEDGRVRADNNINFSSKDLISLEPTTPRDTFNDYIDELGHSWFFRSNLPDGEYDRYNLGINDAQLYEDINHNEERTHGPNGVVENLERYILEKEPYGSYRSAIRNGLRERGEYLPMTASDAFFHLMFPDTYAYGGNLFKKGGEAKIPKWKRESVQDLWWDRGVRIYNMMVNEWGLTSAEAIGIIANMGVESDVDYKSISPPDKRGIIYKGLVQNIPEIVNYIKKYYGDYSEESQLQFLRDGLEGKMRGADKTPEGKDLQRKLQSYRKYMATLDPNDPKIYRRAAGAFNAHYENPQIGANKGRYEVGEPRMYTGEQMGIRLNRMNSSASPTPSTTTPTVTVPTTPKVKSIARPPAKPAAYSGATPPSGPIQFTQEELNEIYGESQQLFEPTAQEASAKPAYTPKYKAKRSKEWEYNGPNIPYIDPDLPHWAAMIIAGVPFNQGTSTWGIRSKNANYGVNNSHHKKAWKGGIDTNKTWYAYRKEVEEGASEEDRKAIKDYFDSIEKLIVNKNYGSALDITPARGYTYDDLLKSFANPILQEWAEANNFGLLDERSAEVRARTGGTGPHLHFGPDSKIPRFKNNALMAYYTPYWEDRAAAMQPVVLPQQDVNFINEGTDAQDENQNITPLFAAVENPNEIRTGTEEIGGFNSGEGSYIDPIVLGEISVQKPKIAEAEMDDARYLLDNYYYGGNNTKIPRREGSIIPDLIIPNFVSHIPSTPMLEVNMATPYTDLIMGRKASKGGKLFDIGGYTQGQLYGGERKYQLVPTTETSQDVFQGYTINPGDLVWADAQGNPIKGSNRQAISDIAALKDIPLDAPPLPQVNITAKANPYKPMPLSELFTVPAEPPKISFDRNAFKEQWLQNDLERQRQEKAHADERARALTPGAGTFVVAPALATLAGIGAAEAAPVLPWLVNNPVGRQLTYSILGGELVNEGTKLFGDLTGNPNNGFGDYMARTTGVGNDFWWGFANPGYALNPTRAAIGTTARVAEDALGNMKVIDPLVEGIKTGVKDYSKGMFNIDLGQAYRTAQMSRALANTYAENARLGLNIGKPNVSDTNIYMADNAFEPDYTSPFKRTTATNDPNVSIVDDPLIAKLLYQSIIIGQDPINHIGTIKTGLPENTVDFIMRNNIARNVRQRLAEGASKEDVQKYANFAKNTLQGIKVGYYPGYAYERAGMPKVGGMYSPKYKFISVNEDSPAFTIFQIEDHEGLHALNDIYYPTSRQHNYLTLPQKSILSEAYGHDFYKLKEWEGFPEHLKTSNLKEEDITTNNDARNYLTRDYLTEDYNGLSLEEKDKIIDNASDDEIFAAVENANGYGYHYIKFLRLNDKLTPEKAQQFREAMKKVGAISAPIATSIAASKKSK